MRMSDWSSDVCSSDLTPSAWLCTARHPDRPDQARPFQRVPEEDVRPDPERPADGSCPKQADLETVQAPASTAKQAKPRSEEHTSELQSLMRISYAVFCLKKKNKNYKIKIRQQDNLNRKRTIPHSKQQSSHTK